METYVVFKGNKRVTLRFEDMRADRIAQIFQINPANIYMTDAANVAIFPLENGNFSGLDLTVHAHYEVHGGEVSPTRTPVNTRHFSFLQPSTSSLPNLPPRPSTPRSFQRSVHVSEILDGRLVSTMVIVVRFVEAEASVACILQKVKVAMANDEEYVLTDVHGNEILESEGTTGSLYWRQNSRKIHALEKTSYQQWQSRRTRTNRRDDETALVALRNQVEELVEASHGLEDITSQIKVLIGHSRSMLQSQEIKQAFACLIYRDIEQLQAVRDFLDRVEEHKGLESGLSIPKANPGQHELYSGSGLFLSSTRLAAIQQEAKKDCLRLFHLLFDEFFTPEECINYIAFGKHGKVPMGKKRLDKSKVNGILTYVMSCGKLHGWEPVEKAKLKKAVINKCRTRAKSTTF